MGAGAAAESRMGAAGREKFLHEFTLDRHLNRMRNVFLDIAGVTLAEKTMHVVEAPAASSV